MAKARKTVYLLIKVQAPRKLKKKAVADLVNDMLNVGFSDAAESLDTDIEAEMREAAEAITDLTIVRPRVLKEKPKCRGRDRAKRKSKKKGSSK